MQSPTIWDAGFIVEVRKVEIYPGELHHKIRIKQFKMNYHCTIKQKKNPNNNNNKNPSTFLKLVL